MPRLPSLGYNMFKSLPQHPMNKIMNDHSGNRLKRNSFHKHNKSLLRHYKGRLLDTKHQLITVSYISPWEPQLDHGKICTPGEEHSEPNKRALINSTQIDHGHVYMYILMNIQQMQWKWRDWNIQHGPQ